MPRFALLVGRSPRAIALMVAALACIGCPRGADQEKVGNCDVSGLFETKCGGSACHGRNGGPGGVDLLSPALEVRLVDKEASYPGLTGCPRSPELLIDSAHPERSLLLTKLRGTHSCGAAMPSPNPPKMLSPTELELVECYVQTFSDNPAAVGDPP